MANFILEVFIFFTYSSYFSFKKKYPKIAKNNIRKDIIKFVFATVVLYIAKTYPQKPKDNIIPPKKPGQPDS